MNNDYLKRLFELVVVTFIGAAIPHLVSGGFDKAGLYAAGSAGLAAVYALVVKKVGDPDRPTIK